MSNKLLHEDTANLGDLVRANDFYPMNGEPIYFIEGTVVALANDRGFRAYVLKVEKDTLYDVGSPSSRVGAEIYVPMGLSLMDYPERIKVLATSVQLSVQGAIDECPAWAN